MTFKAKKMIFAAELYRSCRGKHRSNARNLSRAQRKTMSRHSFSPSWEGSRLRGVASILSSTFLLEKWVIGVRRINHSFNITGHRPLTTLARTSRGFAQPTTAARSGPAAIMQDSSFPTLSSVPQTCQALSKALVQTFLSEMFSPHSLVI